MNRIYRKTWNKVLGQVVVASELASSGSTGVVGMDASPSCETHQRSLAIIAAIGIFSASGILQAAPVAVGGNEWCELENGTFTYCAVQGNAQALGVHSIAIGNDAIASGNSSIAIGNVSSASAIDATAVGANTTASAREAMALGAYAVADATGSVALGANSVAKRANTVSVGNVGSERQIVNVASGTEDTDAVNLAQLNAATFDSVNTTRYFKAMGVGESLVDGDESLAAGSDAAALGDYATAVGSTSLAEGQGASAFGSGAFAMAENAIAIGYNSIAQGANSVALGADSLADRASTVSVGSAGDERQITNVAAGTEGTDAVNKSQLDAVAAVAETSNKYFKATGSDDSDAGAYAEGDNATASGEASNAIGNGASAYGSGAFAMADNATAAGFNALASGQSSAAFGSDAQASGTAALAMGSNAQASGGSAVAVGSEARATEDGASVLGYNSYAQALNSTVIGSNAWTTKGAENSVALGSGSLADRANTVSVGATVDWMDAAGVVHSATDRQITNVAAGTEDTDAVNLAQLNEVADTAESTSRHFKATGAGQATASSNESVAAGSDATANGNRSTALGADSSAHGNNSTAIGAGSGVSSANSVALGAGSQASEANVVSVGGGDGVNSPVARRIVNVADGRIVQGSSDAVTGNQLYATNQRVGVVEERVDDIDTRIGAIEGVTANAVSYDDSDKGAITLQGMDGTRIGNLAAGAVAVGSREAINGGQMFTALSDAAVILGNGAGVSTFGGLIAPSYVIQGASYSSVGAAFSAIDGILSNLDTTIVGMPIPASTSIPTGTGDGLAIGQNSHAQDTGDLALGNNARVGANNSTALGNNTSIAANAVGGVAVGEGATVTAEGAVALGQGSVADRANTVSVGSAGNERQIVNVAAGTQATDAVNKGQLDSGIATANAYTESRLDTFWGQVDQRFRDQDRRIDRQGAMSAAMLNMATSAAGIRTPNRVGVGVGFQNGESALSIGYQRAIRERATVTIGGAMSSADQSVGVGAGFGW